MYNVFNSPSAHVGVLLPWIKKKNSPCWTWRDGLVVKRTDCSSRGPRFDSQHLLGGSQLSLTLVRGDPVPSSGICTHQASALNCRATFPAVCVCVCVCVRTNNYTLGECYSLNTEPHPLFLVMFFWFLHSDRHLEAFLGLELLSSQSYINTSYPI